MPSSLAAGCRGSPPRGVSSAPASSDLSFLELESVPGGTARSGRSPLTAYPWGAHYVPVPMRENRSLIAILREMGVIERLDPSGNPIVGEQFLCRDPGERIFDAGTWWEGLFPEDASDRDRRATRRFSRGDRPFGRRARRGKGAGHSPSPSRPAAITRM